MRAFALMLLAALLFCVLGPLAWLLQHIRYPLIGRPLSRLYWDTAIGIDQLGGAILYGEPDWTISSRTYWLAHRATEVAPQARRYAKWFERLIDAFFGEGHCRRSWENEFCVRDDR